jgi:uncharacterized protein YndB with AHSA1/START domain
MKEEDLVATAQSTVHASLDKVWEAIVNPEQIKKYMFGTTVISDWEKGSKIVWKGEWKGKSYEDKGEILEINPKKELSYSHYSPLTGQPDIPENYHTVTIKLEEIDNQTKVTLTQDKNPSEEAKKHSEENWSTMLSGMKKLLEGDVHK